MFFKGQDQTCSFYRLVLGLNSGCKCLYNVTKVFIETAGPADGSAGPAEEDFLDQYATSSSPHSLQVNYLQTRVKDTNRMRSDEPEWTNNWLHQIGGGHQNEDRPSPPQDGVIQRVS